MKINITNIKMLFLSLLSVALPLERKSLAQGFSPIGIWGCQWGVVTIMPQQNNLTASASFNMQVNSDGSAFVEGIDGSLNQTPFRGGGNWAFQGNTFSFNGTTERQNIVSGIDLGGTTILPLVFVARVHNNPQEMVATVQEQENTTISTKCNRLQ